MDGQVQEVKSKTDIAAIIGERIELKRAGRNFKANCPFHGEKTASFMVSPELQIFKCFGCGESGDVFSFLEKYEGMEFPEALKYLADRAGIKLTKTKFTESGDREKLIEIHTEAIKFYNYYLWKHASGKKILEYLTDTRGLKKETIEEFKIGYAPENSYLINDYLLTKKKFSVSDIEKTGIGVAHGKINFFDRFNGRVVFPLFDHRGNAVGFSGRLLPWDKRDAGKYINTSETSIYHKSSMLYGLNISRQFIKQKKVAIIVEGELDMISSFQAGIRNVVAIKGSALTEDQVNLLSRFAPKFVLALDADFAGDKAARRGITVAQNSGVEVKVAKITGYKDPDEAARGNIESYKKDLIKSEGVWDFLIDSVFGRFNAESGEGKAKISKELIPIIGEIEDRIVQAHYANIVAEKLNVPLEAVTEQLSKFTKGEVQPAVIPTEKAAEKDRRELLQESLMILAFQSDPAVLLTTEIEKLIVSNSNLKIILELKKFINSGQKYDPALFAASLPKEFSELFSNIIFKQNNALADRPDDLKKELDLVQKELKILWIKDNLKILTSQMKEFEKNGDKVQLLKAQNEFNKLAKSLASGSATDSGVIFGEN